MDRIGRSGTREGSPFVRRYLNPVMNGMHNVQTFTDTLAGAISCLANLATRRSIFA